VFDRLQPLRNVDKRNAAVIAAQDYYQMDPNEIDLIINWLWTFATTEKLADYFTVVNVGKIKTIKGMIQKNADVFYSLEETKKKKFFANSRIHSTNKIDSIIKTFKEVLKIDDFVGKCVDISSAPGSWTKKLRNLCKDKMEDRSYYYKEGLKMMSDNSELWLSDKDIYNGIIEPHIREDHFVPPTIQPEDIVFDRTLYMPRLINKHWILGHYDHIEDNLTFYDSLEYSDATPFRMEALEESGFKNIMSYKYVNVGCQKDGWSCGYWVTQWINYGIDKNQSLNQKVISRSYRSFDEILVTKNQIVLSDASTGKNSTNNYENYLLTEDIIDTFAQDGRIVVIKSNDPTDFDCEDALIIRSKHTFPWSNEKYLIYNCPDFMKGKTVVECCSWVREGNDFIKHNCDKIKIFEKGEIINIHLCNDKEKKDNLEKINNFQNVPTKPQELIGGSKFTSRPEKPFRTSWFPEKRVYKREYDKTWWRDKQLGSTGTINPSSRSESPNWSRSENLSRN